MVKGLDPDDETGTCGSPYNFAILNSPKQSWSFTSGIYLLTMKVSAPGPSLILQYSESTKNSCFSILGFFRPKVKLGFDFPRVLPSQDHGIPRMNESHDLGRPFKVVITISAFSTSSSTTSRFCLI